MIATNSRYNVYDFSKTTLLLFTFVVLTNHDGDGGEGTSLNHSTHGSNSTALKGDVKRDDSQRRFLAQHSVAILEQCCNKQ